MLTFVGVNISVGVSVGCTSASAGGGHSQSECAQFERLYTQTKHKAGAKCSDKRLHRVD